MAVDSHKMIGYLLAYIINEGEIIESVHLKRLLLAR